MKWLTLFLVCVVFCSCGPEPVIKANVGTITSVNDTLIDANKQSMELEKKDIVNYLRRHSLQTIETGTGVHIKFFEDLPGPKVRPEQEVLIEHTVSLINGRQCYKSEQGKPESFFVEHDHVESGLHEAIQYLSAGDSALVIIPSSMAHGLVGDLEQIPMRSTVIYNLRLLAVR